MAIFVVLGLGETTALTSNIKNSFPDDYYEVDQDKWLVSTVGTTAKDIALKLGMDRTQKISGMVITFGGYYGFASKDIWEWLKAKAEKVA